MVESFPIKLDKSDKAIMHELERNSRASFDSIGKAVRLSGETVEYRIRRLKRLGVINRMFAEPNLQRLGLKTYRLYLKTENMSKVASEALLSFISTHPRAQWYAEFEGEWDYSIRYTVENECQFKREMDQIIGRFGEFIKSKDVVITSHQTYLPITYLTGKERNARSVQLDVDEKIEELDETDQRILAHLFEDARMKTVDIATKIRISPDAVMYRIRKMVEKGIIAFFTAWFDRRKLGYEYYKVLLWLQFMTKEDEERLIQYCEQHPNIVYINRVLGNWDLEVDFDARNSQEIHDIIKDLKNKFSGMIRNHSTLTILRDGVVNPFGSAIRKNK